MPLAAQQARRGELRATPARDAGQHCAASFWPKAYFCFWIFQQRDALLFLEKFALPAEGRLDYARRAAPRQPEVEWIVDGVRVSFVLPICHMLTPALKRQWPSVFRTLWCIKPFLSRECFFLNEIGGRQLEDTGVHRVAYATLGRRSAGSEIGVLDQSKYCAYFHHLLVPARFDIEGLVLKSPNHLI